MIVNFHFISPSTIEFPKVIESSWAVWSGSFAVPNTASLVFDILNETFSLVAPENTVFLRLQFLKEVSVRVALIKRVLKKSELSNEHWKALMPLKLHWSMSLALKRVCVKVQQEKVVKRLLFLMKLQSLKKAKSKTEILSRVFSHLMF